MTLASNLTSAFQRVGQEDKALRVLINNNATDLSALTTTAKNNLVAAVNELKAEIDSGGSPVAINDATPSTATVYSSSKVESTISASVAALVDSSPGTLDTLNELAAALGDDPDFAASMTTALAAKAPLASPSFTGVPLGPTASVGVSNTQLATTAYVGARVSQDAPSKSGTGATGTWPIAISGNAATATTAAGATGGLATTIAGKAPSASPDLTGVPTAPTALAGTDTTQIATTAFVQAQILASIGDVATDFESLYEAEL